jgi:hypothetical protein
MPFVPEPTPADDSANDTGATQSASKPVPVEKGGPKGPEPTRYGDWERKGRCIDF